MLKRKLVKMVESLLRRVGGFSRRTAKRVMKMLMQTLMRRSRRSNLPIAGFVLPTVTMVMLVVVLLTIAISIRTFDRVQTARNFKVDQAALTAATPAIDRARAKITYLFDDIQKVNRATPNEKQIYQAFNQVDNQNRSLYNFGDEIRLKLVFDSDSYDPIKGETKGKDNVINSEAAELNQNLPQIYNVEESRTAWAFPFDADNNGKFDSYTLYSIQFRNPPRDKKTNLFNRTRGSLDARTSPMRPGDIGAQCLAGYESNRTVGDTDWYQSGGQLRKSFFVYSATVPMTEAWYNTLSSQDKNLWEKNKTAFSALEFQQDRVRIPVSNNAVWFDDDIELGNVASFSLNGRIFTNSNLLVSGMGDPIGVRFYQVSDPTSCYFSMGNAKMVVGGNVARGDIRDETNGTSGGVSPWGTVRVEVDLFRGRGNDPVSTALNGQAGRQEIKPSENITTTENGGQPVGYNVKAYNKRIAALVKGGMAVASDPPVLADASKYPIAIASAFQANFDSASDKKQLLQSVLEGYFRARVRRIPFKDVPEGSDDSTIFSPMGATADVVADAVKGAITTANSGISKTWLSIDDNKLTPNFIKAIDPDQVTQIGKEEFLGDRLDVGNGLPQNWWNVNTSKFSDTGAIQKPVKAGLNWQKPGGANGEIRYRVSKMEVLPDLIDIKRNGYWETQAATDPRPEQNTGGLRVVTGAGIYRPLSDPSAGSPSDATKWDMGGVWSDAQVVPWNPLTNSLKLGVVIPKNAPFLRMRASAVYHYANSPTKSVDEEPIACISSYYDPTNETTAKNLSTLTWNQATGGLSNNGIVYSPPGSRTVNAELQTQAKLRYPDGRWVNPSLYNAVYDSNGALKSGPQTLEDYGAIDAALCAQGILTGSLSTSSSSNIPNGAIKEAAFLDGRQVRSLNRKDVNFTYPIQSGASLSIADGSDLRTDTTDQYNAYTLPIEQHQPLEIRVTDIDLGQLRSITYKTDTLLPNSGLIYATREDALPDLSTTSNVLSPEVGDDLNSSSDFKLDPTRRPNGIRIQGTSLARNDANTGSPDKEKGLILASNNPVYVKAATQGGLSGFNLHVKPTTGTIREEFNTLLANDTSNFYTRGAGKINESFACRDKQPGCKDGGDQWRTATIVADAIDLLSSDFKDGVRSDGDYDLNNNLGNCLRGTAKYDYAYNGITYKAACVNDAGVPFKNAPTVDFKGDLITTTTDDVLIPDVIKRVRQGFWFNSLATNSRYWTNTTTPATPYPETTRKTSYVANGVTPVQRRATFSEYAMEICLKLPVSECGPTDWVAGYDADNNGKLFTDTNNNGVIDSGDANGNGILDGGETSEYEFVDFDVDGDGVCRKTGTGACATTKADIDDREDRVSWSNFTDPSSPLSSSFTKARIVAGSTAQLPMTGFTQYPRRVAFDRNSFGGLSVSKMSCGVHPSNTNKNNRTCATPIGFESDTKIAKYPYDGGKVPQTKSGALWYWTTSDNRTGSTPLDPSYSTHNTAATVGYDATKPLFYYNTDYFLPSVGDIPPDPLPIPGTGIDFGAPLSSSSGTDLGDYTACLGGLTPDGASQGAVANYGTLSGTCPADASTAIDSVQATLKALPADRKGAQSLTDIGDGWMGYDWYKVTGSKYDKDNTKYDGSKPKEFILDTMTTSSDPNYFGDANNDGVYVYQLPKPNDSCLKNSSGGFIEDTSLTNCVNKTTLIGVDNAGTTTTIRLKGKPNQIFVLKAPAGNAISFGGHASGNSGGVDVILNGVDPNNVYWVPDGDLRVLTNPAATSKSTAISGNFVVPSTGSIYLPEDPKGNNTIFGRMLGGGCTNFFLDSSEVGQVNKGNKTCSQLPNTGSGTGATIYSYASNAQPLTMPMLNLHSPTGAPGTNQGTIFAGLIEDQWLQTVGGTNYFNATFVSRNSPSRPKLSNRYDSESGGGLNNFVRLLERWTGQVLRISGNFVQIGQSQYGTAAYIPVDTGTQLTSANQNRSALMYTVNGSNDAFYTLTGGDVGLRYSGGAEARKAPYFLAPTRVWGFDVGLLSQSPDLFAQRFTSLSPNPDEFFRNVSRNDQWINSLICAARAGDNGQGGNNASYPEYLVKDEGQRGGKDNCPKLSDYPANSDGTKRWP